MTKYFILIFLLAGLSQDALASLVGEYELTQGDEFLCPAGNIHFKGNILIFGSRHSWSLAAQDKAVINEKVKGGCSYNLTYEKDLDSFKAKTKRSNCPNPKENQTLEEDLVMQGDELNYTFQSISAKQVLSKIKCVYKKIR